MDYNYSHVHVVNNYVESHKGFHFNIMPLHGDDKKNAHAFLMTCWLNACIFFKNHYK